MTIANGGKTKHSPNDEMGDINLISIRDKIESMRLEGGSSFIRQQKIDHRITQRGDCVTRRRDCVTHRGNHLMTNLGVTVNDS